MSHPPTEQGLLKAIDNYIENGTNMGEMQHIAHSLNAQSTVTSKIHDCFHALLSDFDHTKIKKALDLLEYLTIFSATKVLQLINNDKLIENLAQAVMEYYLQDETLNLLKLWVDEFEVYEDELKGIKTLIENIEPLELVLPSVYCSKYKSAAIISENSRQNPPVEAMEIEEPLVLPPKVSTLLDKAKELVDNISIFLDNPVFEKMTPEVRRKKVNLLLSLNADVTSSLTELRLSEYDRTITKKIEEEIEKLNTCRIRLNKKIDQLQQTDAPVQSQQPNNTGDSYKIIVSDESAASAADSSETKIMELEELLNYKTQPCEAGALCDYAPSMQARRIFNTTPYTHEMHCTGWHNPMDKRRSVYDENYRAMYSFNICDDKDICYMHDACAFSHNFFESAYHPLNYKKKMCKFPRACKNEKYCPGFHTPAEREAWNNTVKQYFEESSRGASFNSIKEDPLKMEISTFKNQDSDSSSGEEVQELPRPQDPGTDGHTLYKQSEFNPRIAFGGTWMGRHNLRMGLQPIGVQRYKKAEEKSPPKGNLHSKLLIRKGYEDPGVLNAFFQKSTIFSGFPFVAGGGLKNEQVKYETVSDDKEKERVGEEEVEGFASEDKVRTGCRLYSACQKNE